MYMAYGWPKTLPITVGLSLTSQPVVHLAFARGLLLLVSSTHIQVWSADQHKLKLGQHVRDSKSVEEGGVNVQAVWNTTTSTVAVLTSGNGLHFYAVNRSGKQLRVSGDDSHGLSNVIIKFISSSSLPLFNRAVTVGCLAADDASITLGCSNGSLHLVSWSGEILGAADIFQGLVAAVGPAYVAEANGSPRSPMLSTLANLPSFNKSSSGRTSNNGFLHLELSRTLCLLVAVLLDGRVLLCSVTRKGLKQGIDINPERWIAVLDGVCTSIAHEQRILAVGTRRGTVELFNLADNASLVRSISLFDWGYSAEDTGPVNCIRWTPDNAAVAVGWRHRGLAVWSMSGCRLMCTIRQGSMSNSFSSHSSHYPGNDLSKSEPMVTGVAALSWGEHGYQLFAVEQGHVSRLVEFSFAKSCLSKSVAGISHVWQVLQAEDRVLLLESDEDDNLKIHHLVIPQSYIGVNWPIIHIAANEDGTYLAIAGRQGLILYDLRSKKWRVFGDVIQERQINCVGLLWLGKIVVVCNFREASKMYELSLYPRYHLDETSLLCRKQLLDKPIAMDSWQEYILVACPPFDIRVFHVHILGTLSPLRPASVQLTTVRDLSIMSTRKPPIAMQFVPTSQLDASSTRLQEGARDFMADAMLRQPTRCMVLRADGELSLLDLDQGSERRLVSGVERFWLTCGRPKEEANLIKEVPWWAYGHRGMQVWYPSSEEDCSQAQDLLQLDPELDFDREVYPLGLCPSAGVIVGVSQRLALSACSEMPCFEPTPQAQPILPCLLRHLLQRDKMEEAVQLAKLSAGRPHFSHSLEWLLFTVFDAAMSSQSLNRKRGKSNPLKVVPQLLQLVCDLIRHFPDYLDVVVSVARKTDSRHWSELFAAAGKSTQLFEECFERRCYRTATCYILVIEKLEGPVTSQLSAIRLLQATLEVSMYELAGELVRFLLRCGKENESSEKEADRNNSGLLTTFFLGFKGSTPASQPLDLNMHYLTVKNILGEHAISLMVRKELPALVSFVRSTQFDLTEFLQSERGKSARLDDFSSALQVIGERFNMDSVQSRLDAEFLLNHMRAVGFREWIVVLATLLKKTEILLELFRGDPSLWQAYSKTMKVQDNVGEFLEFLSSLEKLLGEAR